VHEAVGYELVDLDVDVFNTGVGDDSGRPVEILVGLRQDLTRRGGIEPFRKAPRQDPAGEIVDDGMQVGFRAIEKSDDRHVDMPILVWMRRANAGLWLFRVHAATRSSPTTLPHELRPGRGRRKHLAGSLGVDGQSSKGHVPILRGGDHLFDGADLVRGQLHWIGAWAA
jgi:hypothetical protein